MQSPPSCPTCWKVPDRGWEDVDRQINLFLTRAIAAIATEYANEPIEWLEVNRWPDSGRLIVYPSKNLKGDRDERICCQLFSDHLQAEWNRCAREGVPDSQNEAFQQLGENVWRSVRHSLVEKAAAEQLRLARRVHRLRIAAYDYDFCEGLFHLLDMCPDASEEMQTELAEFRTQWRIDTAPGAEANPRPQVWG